MFTAIITFIARSGPVRFICADKADGLAIKKKKKKISHQFANVLRSRKRVANVNTYVEIFYYKKRSVNSEQIWMRKRVVLVPNRSRRLEKLTAKINIPDYWFVSRSRNWIRKSRLLKRKHVIYF